MDSKLSNFVYENKNFLSIFKTTPFKYEYKIKDSIVSEFNERVETDLADLFTLNLITTNKLINRRVDPNWSIITHSYLETNFNKLTNDKFKSLKGFEYLRQFSLENKDIILIPIYKNSIWSLCFIEYLGFGDNFYQMIDIVKPHIKFSYIYFEDLQKVTNENVKCLINTFDIFLRYLTYIQENTKPESLTKSIANYTTISLVPVKGIKSEVNCFYPIYRIYEDCLTETSIVNYVSDTDFAYYSTEEIFNTTKELFKKIVRKEEKLVKVASPVSKIKLFFHSKFFTKNKPVDEIELRVEEKSENNDESEGNCEEDVEPVKVDVVVKKISILDMGINNNDPVYKEKKYNSYLSIELDESVKMVENNMIAEVENSDEGGLVKEAFSINKEELVGEYNQSKEENNLFAEDKFIDENKYVEDDDRSTEKEKPIIEEKFVEVEKSLHKDKLDKENEDKFVEEIQTVEEDQFIPEAKSISPAEEKQSLEEDKPVQPVEEKESNEKDKSVQPAEEDKCVQPIGGDKSVQPAEEDKYVQPIGGDKSIQPVEEDKFVQNVEEDKSVQKDDTLTEKTKFDKEINIINEESSNYLNEPDNNKPIHEENVCRGIRDVVSAFVDKLLNLEDNIVKNKSVSEDKFYNEMPNLKDIIEDKSISENKLRDQKSIEEEKDNIVKDKSISEEKLNDENVIEENNIVNGKSYDNDNADNDDKNVKDIKLYKEVNCDHEEKDEQEELSEEKRSMNKNESFDEVKSANEANSIKYNSFSEIENRYIEKHEGNNENEDNLIKEGNEVVKNEPEYILLCEDEPDNSHTENNLVKEEEVNEDKPVDLDKIDKPYQDSQCDTIATDESKPEPINTLDILNNKDSVVKRQLVSQNKLIEIIEENYIFEHNTIDKLEIILEHEINNTKRRSLQALPNVQLPEELKEVEHLEKSKTYQPINAMLIIDNSLNENNELVVDEKFNSEKIDYNKYTVDEFQKLQNYFNTKLQTDSLQFIEDSDNHVVSRSHSDNDLICGGIDILQDLKIDIEDELKPKYMVNSTPAINRILKNKNYVRDDYKQSIENNDSKFTDNARSKYFKYAFQDDEIVEESYEEANSEKNYEAGTERADEHTINNIVSNTPDNNTQPFVTSQLAYTFEYISTANDINKMERNNHIIPAKQSIVQDLLTMRELGNIDDDFDTYSPKRSQSEPVIKDERSKEQEDPKRLEEKDTSHLFVKIEKIRRRRKNKDNTAGMDPMSKHLYRKRHMKRIVLETIQEDKREYFHSDDEVEHKKKEIVIDFRRTMQPRYSFQDDLNPEELTANAHTIYKRYLKVDNDYIYNISNEVTIPQVLPAEDRKVETIDIKMQQPRVQQHQSPNKENIYVNRHAARVNEPIREMKIVYTGSNKNKILPNNQLPNNINLQENNSCYYGNVNNSSVQIFEDKLRPRQSKYWPAEVSTQLNENKSEKSEIYISMSPEVKRKVPNFDSDLVINPQKNHPSRESEKIQFDEYKYAMTSKPNTIVENSSTHNPSPIIHRLKLEEYNTINDSHVKTSSEEISLETTIPKEEIFKKLNDFVPKGTVVEISDSFDNLLKRIKQKADDNPFSYINSPVSTKTYTAKKVNRTVLGDDAELQCIHTKKIPSKSISSDFDNYSHIAESSKVDDTTYKITTIKINRNKKDNDMLKSATHKPIRTKSRSPNRDNIQQVYKKANREQVQRATKVILAKPKDVYTEKFEQNDYVPNQSDQYDCKLFVLCRFTF
jgi:hypothetical protein